MIKEDGAVILTDFASPEQLDQVGQDTREVMEARMRDEVSQLRQAALLRVTNGDTGWFSAKESYI